MTALSLELGSYLLPFNVPGMLPPVGLKKLLFMDPIDHPANGARIRVHDGAEGRDNGKSASAPSESLVRYHKRGGGTWSAKRQEAPWTIFYFVTLSVRCTYRVNDGMVGNKCH